MSSINIK
jgi:hypothetical protein